MTGKQKFILAVLLIVGLSQLTGDLLKLPLVKAVGAATGASPAPKVFTAHKGFETYSSRFYLEWRDVAGKPESLLLTPKIYRGIKGPYNRRNAYGATLSYAPVLSSAPETKPMFESAAHYALCGNAPILRELGIDPATVKGPVTVRLEPRQKLPEGHPWQLSYKVKCNE